VCHAPDAGAGVIGDVGPARAGVDERDVSERVKLMNEGIGVAGSLTNWVCECAEDGCVGPVEMTLTEYNDVREDGARFFVVPSDEHVWPDVERVVRRNDRFWVVEKVGEARRGVIRLDPRARANPLRLRT
jgi:hypothetical protein